MVRIEKILVNEKNINYIKEHTKGVTINFNNGDSINVLNVNNNDIENILKLK